MVSLLITVLGWGAIGFVLWRILHSLYNICYPYLVAQPRDLHKLAGGARWAIVTGSTDGIGKAYATELAARGFNLVLISRSADKLAAVAAEINGKNKSIEIRTIQFDFTDAQLADYETKIFTKIADIDIGILVNNVGMVTKYPDRLDRQGSTIGLGQLIDVTVINTLPSALLSAFVLRQMVARGHGVIVNVSSAAAKCEWYWYAVYSAAKKFVTHLSATLCKEYALDVPGVYIQSLCPMLVATKMATRTKGRPSFLVPSPTEYARQALRTVGIVEETAGCLIHQIQFEILFKWIPGPVFNAFMRSEGKKAHDRALLEEYEVVKEAKQN